MAIKEVHGVLNPGYLRHGDARNNTVTGFSFIPKKDFYILALRAQGYIYSTGDGYIELYKVNPKTLTNTLYNQEKYTRLAYQYFEEIVEPSNNGNIYERNWTNFYYFSQPIRLYAGQEYAIQMYVQYQDCSNSSYEYSFNTDLIQYTGTRGLTGWNPGVLNVPNKTNGYSTYGLTDFLAETFDYSYLVRDRKETKKIFVPTIDTDLTLSQDNLGDWNLNKLQSNNTTSVSFPIFKDVKYNLTIPEGAKFCYAGTLDKKVSDFDDSETRVLNRILVDDATVTNPFELEFTALQNERSFVAYINDADAGLTPDQVTLTGTAGYELYKLTNEEGTEYEALPDFDITSEQFKNGSPLFVEPQANILMDFAHPSVLYWQEKEDDNPMLQVKITATPHSQHVTGDKISLEVDGVLCDIAEMQVDSEGGAILAFSFDDKQTWVYWKPENENDVNVGEWVTITEADKFNGQSKDVTDALSPANWKLAIGDADGFYIRASFISTSQSLAKIGVKYSAREDATTTEVETEGTD